MEMQNFVIKTNNLCKTYKLGTKGKKREAIKGLNLSVPQNHIYGFIGPNGAGKTTLIKIMVGLLRPTSGSIKIFDEDWHKIELHQRIGYLPEQPCVYTFMNGEEILQFYAKLFNLPKPERKERIDYLLNLVGLEENRLVKLEKYSKGMLQRIGIAQALINQPELIILDEPSSGLDPIGQKEIRDIILDLKKEGKTIFISSHQLSEIEMYCDWISIINKGELIKEGEIEGLLNVEDELSITAINLETTAKDKIGNLSSDMIVRDNKIIAIARKEKVFDIIEIIKENNGIIESILPKRMTLEDLFLKLVKE